MRSNSKTLLAMALLSALSPAPAFADKGQIQVDSVPAVVARPLMGTCPGPETHQPIYNQQDLENITQQMLANNGPHLKYRQCTDIEITANGMYPIGRASNAVAQAGFQGEYLGQGRSISGLRKVPNVADHSFGLFLKLDGALVKDLELRDMQYSGSHHAGAVASMIDNSQLENIRITNAQVHSHAHESGAIAGYIANSSLKNLDIEARVRNMGGLAYSITNSSLEDIEVNITRSAGGATYGNFAGVADYFSESSARDVRISVDASAMNPNSLAGFAQAITRSQLDSITVLDPSFPHATATAAGIAREAALSSLSRIRVRANIDAEYLAGGIVGRSKGSTIVDSTFEGTVTALDAAGGIAGATADIDPAFGTAQTRIERVAVKNATISSPYAAGGIVGTMYDHTVLLDSYSLAHVTHGGVEHASFAGGIAGIELGSAQISRVYSSGQVNALGNPGGIVGWSTNPAGITHAIYNSDLMPINNGLGAPATQHAMLNDTATYVGFDLENVWLFSPGTLPELRVLRNSPAPTVDFNGDGQVNVADIFAYLTAYFAGDSRADMDGDSALTPADIFSFLALYFAA